MAHCDFPKEFGEVHGTLSKKIIRNGKDYMVRRVIAQVRNGKQRIYVRDTPVGRCSCSPKAVDARNRFTEVSQRIKSLTPEQRDAYAREWKAAKYVFNGKKYATLRGYISARLFKEQSPN